MTDHPYHFQTNIPPTEWDPAAAAQFGSKVRKGAHRLVRVVAANDDQTIGDAIAAAIVGFSRMDPGQRAELYAAINEGQAN